MENKKIIKQSIFAVIMSLLLVLSVLFILRPVTKAQSTQTKLEILYEKLNKVISKEKDLTNRFLGTAFAVEEQTLSYDFNITTDLGRYPKNQVKTMPSYQLLLDAFKRKLTAENATEEQAETLKNELFLLFDKYGFSYDKTNIGDGFFFIPFDAKKSHLYATDGETDFYEKKDSQDYQEFSEVFKGYNESYIGKGGTSVKSVALAKVLGNFTEYSFTIDDTKYESIENVTFDTRIVGNTPKVTISSNKKAFNIGMPSGVYGDMFVLTITYKDKMDSLKTIKNVSIVPEFNQKLSYETNVAENKKGLFGSTKTYQEGITERIDNLIKRCQEIVVLDISESSKQKVREVKAKLENFKTNFNSETISMKAIYNECLDLFDIENTYTIRSIIREKADTIDMSIDINNKNAIYNHVDYQLQSLKDTKVYIANIYQKSKEYSLIKAIEEVAILDTIANNTKLKVNYEPLEKFIVKVKELKAALLYNWYNANGQKADEELSKMDKLVKALKTGKSTLSVIKIKSLTEDFVKVINKLTPYDPNDALNLKNPYDENTGGNTNPSANTKFSIEIEYEKYDNTKFGKYDYANTLFKAIKNPVIIEKVGNDHFLYIELTPIIIGGEVILAVKNFENSWAGSAPFEILEKEKVQLPIPNGTQEIEIARKIKTKLHKYSFEGSDLKKAKVNIDFYYKNRVGVDWDGMDLVFKLSTKHEIGSATLDATVANQVIQEINTKDYSTLLTSLKNDIQIKKDEIAAHITNNDIAQDQFNVKVNELKDLVKQADDWLELQNEISVAKIKLDGAKATNSYTDESIQSFEEKITQAETSLANNEQATFAEHVKTLKKINQILILKTIQYDTANDYLNNIPANYFNLPNNVKEDFVNNYNALKSYCDNKNAPTQETVDNLLEALKNERTVLDKYIVLKNLYDEKLAAHNQKNATGKYTEQSIIDANSILTQVKQALDTNDKSNFDNEKNKLENIDLIYKLNNAVYLADGIYTITVILLNKENTEISHGDDAIKNRAKLVVSDSGTKYTVYINLMPIKNYQQTTGVLTKIEFLDYAKTITEINTDTINISYGNSSFSYNYPTLISFELDTTKSHYKVDTTSKSPVFGNEGHVAEALLKFDLHNISTGYLETEVSKKGLIHASYEIEKTMKTPIPNSVKDKLSNLKEKIKTAINNIFLTKDDVNNLIKEAAKLFDISDKYQELKTAYDTSISSLEQDKKNDLLSKESLLKRKEDIEKAFRNAEDFLVEKYDISKFREEVLKINQSHLLNRYNTSSLKAKLDEAKELNKIKKNNELKELIVKVEEYLQECETKLPTKKPTEYLEQLTTIVDTLKSGLTPTPPIQPQNPETKLLNRIKLNNLLFNLSQNQAKHNTILTNKEVLKACLDVVYNFAKEDKIVNDSYEKAITEIRISKFEKNAKILKGDKQTQSKLDKYLTVKKVAIKEKDGFYTLELKFNKGYVTDIKYENKLLEVKEVDNVEVYTLSFKKYSNLIKLTVKIKAMGSIKDIYLKLS